MWGTDKQSHYRQGRSIKEIMRSEIDGQCLGCGYLTLKSTDGFEEHNGGLTVKRSQVKIIDDKTGSVVQKLRPRKGKDGWDDFLTYYSCNACVNDWK